MAWLKKVGAVLGIAGSMAAAERGTAHAETAGHQESMQTPHVEKYVNPSHAFTEARDQVCKKLNMPEVDFDKNTFGDKLKGDGWVATIGTDERGREYTEVTVTGSDGEKAVKRFELRKDKVEPAKDEHNNPIGKDYAYSIATGIDMHDADAIAANQAIVDVVRNAGRDMGPKGGEHIATNDEE
jgi:hypothetical protein